MFAQSAVQSRVILGAGSISIPVAVSTMMFIFLRVYICPGARLAGVHVGARSCIGIGASVIQGVHIGKDVTVGAGAS